MNISQSSRPFSGSYGLSLLSRFPLRTGRCESALDAWQRKLVPLQGRIMIMRAAIQTDAYTPSQVSAVTGLSLPAVHKAIEYKLIRPKRVREGRVVQRLLSKAQMLYLQMEAKGLRSLPLSTRRQVARAVEQDPGIDAMFMWGREAQLSSSANRRVKKWRPDFAVCVRQPAWWNPILNSCTVRRCTKGPEFRSMTSRPCFRRERRQRRSSKATPR